MARIIGLAGDKLYVVNNDDPGDMSGSKPNYTGFRIEVNGRLMPIRGSTVELETPWRPPTQVLVVDEKFIYNGDFGSDLKGHGHPYQLALSSDDNWLYIVKTRTFKETPIGDGSVLNVLRVLPDGTVKEVGSSPVTLPVRDDLLARPQGVAAH